MTESLKRFDANSARAVVEAYRLGVNELAKWANPIYEQIRGVARDGLTSTTVVIKNHFSDGLGVTERPNRTDLFNIILLLKQDGYLVDQDAGVLTINWGRMA